MKQWDEKVKTKELIGLIIIIIVIQVTDATPSLLFKTGLNATWMYPFVWGIMLILPLKALFSLLKQYKNKNFIEIVYILAGKYIGLIVGMMLFIILFTSAVVNSRSYTQIVKVTAFPSTPEFAIQSVAILSAYFVASRGFEVITRVSWIMLPYIKLGLLFLVVFVFPKTVWEFIFPLQGPGILEIIKTGIQNFSIIGEYLILAVAFPLVRSYDDYVRANVIGFGIAIFEMAFILIFYLAIYDYVGLQKIAFPLQETARLIEIGEFISNFEGPILAIWIIAGIIRYAFYIYAIAAIFGYTIKIKKIDPLLLSFSSLIIIIGMMPKNIIETTVIIRKNILLSNSWIFFLSVPILLWGIEHWKGEYKK